uniref:uncharacterized protein LOC118518598 isoform X2 n=1 Tax=Halichoerus grypus TaxID=9711 RepID=UPI001658D3B0|nr:uncharacterized protein LOC118518598 isoform X2 [Halichoerus grypus]
MSQAPAPGPPPKVGFAQLALYRQPVRSKDNVCNRQSVGTLRAGGVSKGENGMNQEDGEMHASQLMQGLLRTGLSYVGNAACNNVMTFCRWCKSCGKNKDLSILVSQGCPWTPHPMCSLSASFLQKCLFSGTGAGVGWLSSAATDWSPEETTPVLSEGICGSSEVKCSFHG